MSHRMSRAETGGNEGKRETQVSWMGSRVRDADIKTLTADGVSMEWSWERRITMGIVEEDCFKFQGFYKDGRLLMCFGRNVTYLRIVVCNVHFNNFAYSVCVLWINK